MRRPRRDPLAQRHDVVERAVDEAAAVLESVEREARGVRAGGEDEPVVRVDITRRGGDRAGLTVDAHHPRVGLDPHPLVVEDGRVEGEVVGALAAEVAGQPDPVVRPAPLIAQHRDAPAPLGVAGDEALDEAVRHHAGADDDDDAG